MSLQAVPVGRDAPNDINVIIEIPMHSPAVKYEVDLETGKWVNIQGWANAEAARQEIMESIERYNSLPEKPRNW